MTRVAVVDIGSNTTRLLIADVDDGHVADLRRESVITRLGEGVDARGLLLPVPIARVRNVLVDYRRLAEAHNVDHTLAIATSAVRDAANGEAFLGEIEWSYGFTARVLTGREEAALTFAGVTSDRKIDPGTLVVDIGGGSTELAQGDPDGLCWHESIDVGSVRLTERFLRSDPPSAEELALCALAVRELLAESVSAEVRANAREAIGVAGTITSIAALDLGLADYDSDRVHGHELSSVAVHTRLKQLAALPVAERRKLPSLEPERAPVIVAGVVILKEILAFFALESIEVSERDILHGGALEAAALPDRVEGDAPPGAYTCC